MRTQVALIVLCSVAAILFFGSCSNAIRQDSTLTAPGESWTQFGGENQSFIARSTGLSSSWPESGPRTLWRRDLGEGYSAILAESGKLYTMFRDAEKSQEGVICLDASSGETVWEFRYDSGPKEGHVHQFGDGPRSTPLISGDRIYTIGIAGQMHALDKNTGEVAWSHDLWEEFGGNFLNHGYSSSPIEYNGTIIALVGGEGHSVMAFDSQDGTVVWKGMDFKNSYSTPTILNIDGEEQLVTFMASEIVGVDPDNGRFKWAYPHENQWGQNINMPVMADANYLFLSSPEAGARGLKLTNRNGKTHVEEIWSTRKIQFYHVTSVREGDWVYGSTGTMGPAFLAAVNIKTGEIAWRERGFAKANCVGADGKLLILDEDGALTLARVSPEGLTVLSSVDLLDKVAWTVPTVIGKTMYVRDKGTIAALDLG